MRLVVENLRSEDTRFKTDDLLLLRGGGTGIRLGMDKCGIDRLLRKGRLATIPHDGSEKSQIG
jgi:hypothetical protein